jgi:hypothetical protein
MSHIHPALEAARLRQLHGTMTEHLRTETPRSKDTGKPNPRYAFAKRWAPKVLLALRAAEAQLPAAPPEVVQQRTAPDLARIKEVELRRQLHALEASPAPWTDDMVRTRKRLRRALSR